MAEELDEKERTSTTPTDDGMSSRFVDGAIGLLSEAIDELLRRLGIQSTQRDPGKSREARVERVMFAASSSAYGDSEVLPKVESMPTAPLQAS